MPMPPPEACLDASTETAPRYLERGSAAYARANWGLFIAGFSTFWLLYCVQPLLPLLARDFGVSPAASSLALSLSTAFLAVAIVMAAAVSEGLGRKGVMFASLFATSVLTIATALAPDWHVLLLIRAVEGLALGGVPAVAMAYLAEEMEPAGLGLAMGLYVAGTAFGGMAGRVATGFLTQDFGWRWALGAMGVEGLAAAAGFLALLPRSRNFIPRPGFDPAYHWRAWKGHLATPGLPLLFVIGGLGMGSFVTLYNYAGFHLTAPGYGLGQAQLGLIFTVYVFGMASSPLAGWLADRIGRRAVLPIGIAITALGVILSLAQPLWAVVGGIAVVTFGFFFAHSIASGWVGMMAKGAKGHASSLYLLTYYVGSSVAGSAGGWFWSAHGWPGVAGFVLVMLALALAAAVRLRAHGR